jgi:hypothetical protein
MNTRTLSKQDHVTCADVTLCTKDIRPDDESEIFLVYRSERSYFSQDAIFDGLDRTISFGCSLFNCRDT